jgi:hypothetical protein
MFLAPGHIIRDIISLISKFFISMMMSLGLRDMLGSFTIIPGKYSFSNLTMVAFLGIAQY